MEKVATNHRLAVNDGPLEYSTVMPTQSRFSLLGTAATLSIVAGVVVVLMACFGWEVQLGEMPKLEWPRLANPLYHNGNIYSVDPFWIASFGLILPAIWAKRRLADRIGTKNSPLRGRR